MTHAELDELDRLAGAATPGPWTSKEQNPDRHPAYDAVFCVPEIWDSGHDGGEQTGLADAADAAFIAAARDAVPALVAEVRRLRAELAAVRDAAVPFLPPEPWHPSYADDLGIKVETTVGAVRRLTAALDPGCPCPP